MKWLVIIIGVVVIMSSINLVSALEVSPWDFDPLNKQGNNYTTINTNSSQYWDNLDTPADIALNDLDTSDGLDVTGSITVGEDSTFQKDISILNGNLGIGTTARGTTSVWLERNNPTFVMRDAGVGQTKFGDYGGIFSFEVDEDAENVANARMSIWISGIERMYLNKDGMGLSRRSPRARLDVNGSAIVDGDLNVTEDINANGNLQVDNNISMNGIFNLTTTIAKMFYIIREGVNGAFMTLGNDEGYFELIADNNEMKIRPNGAEKLSLDNNSILDLQSVNATTGYSVNNNVGSIYVYRTDDPSSYDFDETDLTLDSTWRDLDLSSVIPEGAKAVQLYVRLTDDTSTGLITFRKNGFTGTTNQFQIRNQVANKQTQMTFVCPVDSNGVIEYYSLAGMDSIDIMIMGWYM